MDDLPTFDEFVDELRRRLGAADALKPSELHDFRELMSDYADKVGDNWYSDAFDELEAQGHLDPASGKTMGPTVFGRLSARRSCLREVGRATGRASGRLLALHSRTAQPIRDTRRLRGL
jgi:hypothetical protein